MIPIKMFLKIVYHVMNTKKFVSTVRHKLTLISQLLNVFPALEQSIMIANYLQILNLTNKVYIGTVLIAMMMRKKLVNVTDIDEDIFKIRNTLKKT